MKSYKNLFILLTIVFAPGLLLAADFLTPRIPSTLTSPKADKKPKKEFPFRQIASFYPAKALSNCMMAGYERQVGAKHVIKIAAGYSYFAEQSLNTGFNNDLKDYSGARFDFMLKYFIGKEAVLFNGLYVAPYFSFKNATFKYDKFFDVGFGSDPTWEEGDATSYTTGFILGLQVPLGKSFAADIFVGNALIKSSGDYKQASRFMDSYRNSIGLISGFSFGFGF